jgi:hypothetical protein
MILVFIQPYLYLSSKIHNIQSIWAERRGGVLVNIIVSPLGVPVFVLRDIDRLSYMRNFFSLSQSLRSASKVGQERSFPRIAQFMLHCHIPHDTT